ncbi:MAG: TIGR04222 domain-containing membrane protein [Blastocatellia bacterium]
MNPFDLRGPEFLLFYFCFSLAVIFAVFILRRRAESGPAPKIDLGDPYLIAYLRGGYIEASRVVVFSLIDRGMLVMDGELVRRADHVTDNMVKHPVEQEALKKFSVPDKSASVFMDENMKSAIHTYRYKLEEAGLLPDSDVRMLRFKRFLMAVMALVIVGVIKILIGLDLDKPVGGLVFTMIIAIIIAAYFSFPSLTALGKATLADVTNLYSGLRPRVDSFKPGIASAEVAMFAAVFGLAALPATEFAHARTLLPQSTTSSSGSSDGGSSCGSSSDGGSSCGSGGCGGCGS